MNPSFQRRNFCFVHEKKNPQNYETNGIVNPINEMQFFFSDHHYHHTKDRGNLPQFGVFKIKSNSGKKHAQKDAIPKLDFLLILLFIGK